MSIKQSLGYYFGVRIHSGLSNHSLNVPSAALEISGYLFNFWIAVNYPRLQSSTFQSFIHVNFLPRYFDIRKLKQGDVAWKFSWQFRFGRKRYMEDVYVDSLVR